ETKAEALTAISMRPPDAVVLDLVLPDGSGVDVSKEVRKWSQLPILVLSAVGDEREKVRALDAGADDYVTKPFGTDELLARMRASMRRVSPEPESPITVLGPLTVDLAGRTVSRDGERIHLTPTEYDLLRVLVTHAGRVVTHRQLLREARGPAYEEDTPLLRVHIVALRRKLGLDPGTHGYIANEPGIGYRLLADV